MDGIRKKVLFVDDDVDFGQVIVRFFADKPYEIFVANTLSDGMHILERERPEHLFLDNRLPDGLGWEQTQFILDKYPQTQLNLLSAQDIPKTTTSSFRLLAKPISMDELMACLD